MVADKAERARHTFECFLAACPALARGIQSWHIDPEDRHADVNCVLADGSRMDFQLVEWLEAEQMRESVNRKRAEESVLTALLGRYPQPPSQLRSAVLEPKPEIRQPTSGELAAMIEEFGSLVGMVGEELARHPDWDGPQGYLCCNLEKWATLCRYFLEVHFNHYLASPGWIMFSLRGGSFDPSHSLRALREAVSGKGARYGPPDAEMPLDLIVHYSRASTHNTPFHTPEIQDLEDAAKWLARQMPRLVELLRSSPFRRIYLLDERRPGPQAFLVFPSFRRPGV